MSSMTEVSIRNNWSREEVEALFCLPFNDLVFKAQQVHRCYFDPNEVQVATLLSIKTGTCPEDCKYCSQSGHYNTGLEKEALMAIDQVVQKAREAKAGGASRFCMGAAWRGPSNKNLQPVLEMIRQVKSLGLETCVTLGMLTAEQTKALADSGLDYYNHNLDTSPEFYGRIVTTRIYEDRLSTLSHVRNSGIKVCSGGIIGMGENMSDRAGLLMQLANLPAHPESVPINQLIKVAGTPLENVDDMDPFDFVRCVAVARIMMPKAHVRLSAGRSEMCDEMQALAFLAGANSIFVGETLLTAPNPDTEHDMTLFRRLGIRAATRDFFDKGSDKDELFYNAAG